MSAKRIAINVTETNVDSMINDMVIDDTFTISILPLKLLWTKCSSCSSRIIEHETCDMMSCNCIYCFSCTYHRARCSIHRKPSIAIYYNRRIDFINKYDLLIHAAIDLPIESIIKQLHDCGDASRLLAHIRNEPNKIDKALFFEEDTTYDLAIVLVAKAAIKYYVFRLSLPINIVNQIHEANIQYLYMLLKKAHIHIAKY